MRIKLKNLREGKNLTVDKLANILEISSSHMYKIESGIRNPNMALAKRIADYFGKDIEDIFFDKQMDETSIDDYTA